MAVWRAARALQATRALEREWLAVATPLVRPGLAVPAFVVDVPYPLVAATGILRPRLFISARVLSACGDEELNAILAHEAGHVAGRDNLCRLLIRACPDTLRRGRHERALDRAWSAAAEQAADRFALERGVAGVDLASSLLAVARTGRTPALGALASAFLEDDDLERRVRSALVGPAYRQPAAWTRGLRPSGLLLLVLAAALAVTPGALSSIHELVELGVGYLR
jgi:beta-lactamase regulating signal transducer with metallopeptidase domain